MKKIYSIFSFVALIFTLLHSNVLQCQIELSNTYCESTKKFKEKTIIEFNCPYTIKNVSNESIRLDNEANFVVNCACTQVTGLNAKILKPGETANFLVTYSFDPSKEYYKSHLDEFKAGKGYRKASVSVFIEGGVSITMEHHYFLTDF